MTDDTTSYETRTVRVVRGLEGRTISKWEAQGWEFVSQSRGKLQTDILIRRPKQKLPKGLLLAACVLVSLLVISSAVVALMDQSGDEGPSESTSTVVSSSETTSDVSSSAATQTKPTKTEPAVLTVKNSPELASMLKLGNYCDESIEKFAKKYEGRTIAFEANIGAMAPHGSAKTRYDILLTAGPYSETTSPGPAFQFRDENTTSDLHYKGDAGDTIGVGTNLYIKAEVKEYEPSTCLFLLEPVETTVHMPR